MKKNQNKQIDIVVTWVDFFDPKWQKDYLKYVNDDKANDKFVGAKTRYCPQDTFKYFFRGIEKFAPWFNKIYFVTYGHVPAWLNTSYEKLVIVKHSDFIPPQYLPTFNSNTILLNLHKIKDLSENFILFNDDMYLSNFCKETDFFKNGLPCDMAILNPIVAPDFDPFWDMMLNDICVINRNFSKTKVIKNNILKWFSLKYGLKNNFRNFAGLFYKKFYGFYDCHLPNPHLKSIFSEIWNKEYDVCDKTCSNKFRTGDDITEWTMKYWQLAEGKFQPYSKHKSGIYVSLRGDSYKNLIKLKKRYKMVCINDDKEKMDDVVNYFNSFLPEKSAFEK